MKVLYHDDADGMVSAWCIHVFIKYSSTIFRNIKYIPMNYGKDFPIDTIKKDETVYIVDYSISLESMDALLKLTENVVWIDHHKTAIDKYKGYKHKIKGIRNIGEAACVLTFQYLSWYTHYGQGEENFDLSSDVVSGRRATNSVPEFVKFIGDRDIWKFKYGNRTLNFYAGIMTYDLNPTSIYFQEAFIEGTNKFEKIGEHIIRYKKNWCMKYTKSHGYKAVFEGHKCIVVNISSLVGMDCFPEYILGKNDICILYVYSGTRYTVSLYSSQVDVSEIAKNYGGGGHSGAAGFNCSTLPF